MDAVQGANTAIAVVAEIALEAGEAALIVQFPWLGLPGIKQVWEFFASRLMDKVISEFQKGADTKIIVQNKNAQAIEAQDSATELERVVEDQNATEEQRQKARQDFKDKYRKLIRQRIATPN